jgi:hypothetical protein
MKKELIQINTDALIKAYKESSNDCKNILESLFGEEIFKSKDITERIKTFDDAYKALGESHPYVVQYDQIFACLMDGEEEIPKDIIAYLKLRIIAAALNEGWEPRFAKKEKRYSPCFVSYTQKEIGETDEEQKSHVAFRSSSNADASVGIACMSTIYDSSDAIASIGSRLAFKSSELAKYAGEQFVEIWADYVFKP